MLINNKKNDGPFMADDTNPSSPAADTPQGSFSGKRNEAGFSLLRDIDPDLKVKRGDLEISGRSAMSLGQAKLTQTFGTLLGPLRDEPQYAYKLDIKREFKKFTALSGGLSMNLNQQTGKAYALLNHNMDYLTKELPYNPSAFMSLRHERELRDFTRYQTVARAEGKLKLGNDDTLRIWGGVRIRNVGEQMILAGQYQHRFRGFPLLPDFSLAAEGGKDEPQYGDDPYLKGQATIPLLGKSVELHPGVVCLMPQMDCGPVGEIVFNKPGELGDRITRALGRTLVIDGVRSALDHLSTAVTRPFNVDHNDPPLSTPAGNGSPVRRP